MPTADHVTEERPAVEQPPSAAELERLMGAYLAAMARVRIARAALREGLARHTDAPARR